MQESVIENSYVYKLSKFERIKIVFNQIIKFLGDILFILFVGIVIVIFVYSLYTKKNGNNGYVPLISSYVIISTSMVPTINVSDAVLSYRPNISSLKKGDIITFSSTDARYPGLTVTHRILSVNKENDQISFRTKGDNNTTPDDSLVLGSNIYGKVFFIIPWIGYLQIFLSKPFGWLLLVVFPCIGIIIYDIIKLSKTFKNSKITSDIKFKNVEILDDTIITEIDEDTSDVNDENNDSKKIITEFIEIDDNDESEEDSLIFDYESADKDDNKKSILNTDDDTKNKTKTDETNLIKDEEENIEKKNEKENDNSDIELL